MLTLTVSNRSVPSAQAKHSKRSVSVSKKPKVHDPYISTYIRVSYSVLRVDISIAINRFAFFTP